MSCQCLIHLKVVPTASGSCWTNYFATTFRLCRIARSSTAVFIDLLLVCCLANTTCAIMNIMTALIFIILIVSRLHAFFLVVLVRSSLHIEVIGEQLVGVTCVYLSRHEFMLVESTVKNSNVDLMSHVLPPRCLCSSQVYQDKHRTKH